MHSVPFPMPGAHLQDGGRCEFIVWGPLIGRLEIELVHEGRAGRRHVLRKDEWGYHSGTLEGLAHGTEYQLVLDGNKVRPDPASRWQQHGVHGPSSVVSSRFPWSARDWRNIPLEQYVIYELHVGTFTPEGTFDAIVPYLPYLRELGVTAVEIMPIAQFPGSRNWGYDGVLPYATQDSYGGPDGLRRLVDACHREGLAVVLDVVYNHLGPEGNYLFDFGPYFTDAYRTPWGQALNFDRAESDHVRNYFIQNAIYWTRDCHVDALRLDAVHAILDHAALPFIEELAARVHEAAAQVGREVYLIAESSDNDARLITERDRNGYGMDAQWSDDFHHAVHTVLTGERDGYYQDYGRVEHLEKAYREGYVYTGEFSSYRRRRHGVPSAHLPGQRFVVCVQNHDQVGNRMLGERLSSLVPLEARKLAAASLLLSPNVPLLFMGEEYGELAPFQYFISHTDEDLVEAVRQGRKEEFADFEWSQVPPDPQSVETFESCKLDHGLRDFGEHAELLAWYRNLLYLRRSIPALSRLDKQAQSVSVSPDTPVLSVHRWHERSEVIALLNVSSDSHPTPATLPKGRWKRILESTDEGGATPEVVETPGMASPLLLGPYHVVLFVKE